MEAATLAALAGLALVDSTSIGTLVVPVWLLLSPRLRVGGFLVYLATVAAAYAALGAALLLGADAAVRAADGGGLERLAGSTAVDVVQLLLGLALVALSVWVEPARVARRRARRGTGPAPGRSQRWRAVLETGRPSPLALVGLGLAATATEAATMLPYLGAVGVLSAADLPLAQAAAVLCGYVLVMVAPALVLLAVRVLAARWAQPRLERLGGWLGRQAAGAMSWVLGVAGVLVALDALARLSSPLL